MSGIDNVQGNGTIASSMRFWASL